MLIPLLAFAVLAAALAACGSPTEDSTGTITVSLNRTAAGARAAAWPPDDETLNKLAHKIFLTGPGATQTHELNGGNTTLNFTVIEGIWTITVEAYLDGDLYAIGSDTVEIKAGENKQVPIYMNYAGPVKSIIYYWVDEHDELVTTGGTSVASGETVRITVHAAGYTVRFWYLDGEDTGQTGNTYDFSSTKAGKHTVGLFVEKDGKLYNTNITITVE